MTRFDAADAALTAGGRAAFPRFRLTAVARTASTQDLARAAARAGVAPGWCVVAGEQTAGRGRQGRRWSAPDGAALLTSIVLRAEGRLGWLPLAAGVAVAEAIEAICGVGTRLKWPNDVIGPEGGKLAGLLAEVEPMAPGPGTTVVLGLGINLSVDAFPPGVEGASLHRLCLPAPPPSAEALLGAVLTALAARLDQVARGDTGGLEEAWLARALGIGQRIEVDTPSGRRSGVASGLDGDGALLLETAGGIERLLAADVHLLPLSRR